jgi:ribosomal protein S18 acetylase RimI-like enzyme
MATIDYTSDVSALTPESLEGFFVGWPQRPSGETLLRLLSASTHRVLALDSSSGKCVGYVTALSDGVLFGYVSSLEVLPEYQGEGIGQELMARMMSCLSDLYAIDLVCDEEVQPFYERCGLKKCFAMVARRPERIIQ